MPPSPEFYEAREARRDRVERLTRNGLTANEIAVQLRVTQRTVVRDRRARGVSLAGPADRMRPDEIEQAIALLDDGCSYFDVSNTIGRSFQAVKRNCPGYELSKAERAKRSAFGRQLASI